MLIEYNGSLKIHSSLLNVIPLFRITKWW